MKARCEQLEDLLAARQEPLSVSQKWKPEAKSTHFLWHRGQAKWLLLLARSESKKWRTTHKLWCKEIIRVTSIFRSCPLLIFITNCRFYCPQPSFHSIHNYRQLLATLQYTLYIPRPCYIQYIFYAMEGSSVAHMSYVGPPLDNIQFLIV